MLCGCRSAMHFELFFCVLLVQQIVPMIARKCEKQAILVGICLAVFLLSSNDGIMSTSACDGAESGGRFQTFDLYGCWSGANICSTRWSCLNLLKC